MAASKLISVTRARLGLGPVGRTGKSVNAARASVNATVRSADGGECAGLGVIGSASQNCRVRGVTQKKNGLKDHRRKEVLEALRPFWEPADTPDAQVPVRACFRCISNHSNFLDYQGALAAGLPMGSGEVASAHRYVFQDRRKVPGGWWKMENLKKMIGLNRYAVGGGAAVASV